RELVCLNVDARPGKRLRVWDRIQQDLVERVVTDERTPSLVLGLTMSVGPVGIDPIALRLARDTEGRDPILSPDETLAAANAERDTAARERDTAARERDAALAKLAALEKNLGAKKATKRRPSRRT